MTFISVQSTQASSSTNYYFAIPATHTPYSSDYLPRVLITTSSSSPVQTWLTTPEFEIYSEITYTSPADIRLPVTARIPDEGWSNHTIVIQTSSDDIAVHAFDNEYYGGSGFLVLPSIHLGTDYFIVCYVPYSASFPCFFTVSANGNETAVNILTNSGHGYNLSLKPHESYRFEGADFEDLTGTRVQSNHPVSVTSGVFTRVPEGVSSYEGLLVNLPPVNNWGKHFVLAPFLSKTCGYAYRVISGPQTTTIIISGNNDTIVIELTNGEFYEGDVTTDKMITITSNFPVLVVKYMKGFYACDDNYRGDPAMIVVASTDDYRSGSVTFPVFNTTDITNTKIHFINILTRCDDIHGFILDESVSIGTSNDWDQLSTDDYSMCLLRGEVSTGVHRLANPIPTATFSVSVYMMCTDCTTAYAYQAGFNYKSKIFILFMRHPT